MYYKDIFYISSVRLKQLGVAARDVGRKGHYLLRGKGVSGFLRLPRRRVAPM